MITYVTGDLVNAFMSKDVDVIAHQANCFNTMRSGVAKAIVEEYPEAAKADQQTTKGDASKLGTISFAVADRVRAGMIYNLYGQFHYGRDGGQYTIYPALENAMHAMADDLRERGYLGKIGLPKLGCGLAGGKWSIVESIIERQLADWEVIVYSLEENK